MSSWSDVLFGTALGFIGTELASYVLHRYLFHGWLWKIHRSHHLPRKGLLEWNDVFSLGFAALAILLMVNRPQIDFVFGIGAGISIYGTIYFVLHDLYTHGRGLRFETRNSWFNQVRQAHRKHHQSSTQLGQEPFGLLLFKSATLPERK